MQNARQLATHLSPKSTDMQFNTKFTALACGILTAMTSIVSAAPPTEVSSLWP